MRAVEENGLKLYQWRIFDAFEADVVFSLTCRLGGESDFPSSSLNLGHTVGDNQSSLIGNRRAVNHLLGAREETPWAYCNQVHGNRIVSVDAEFSQKDVPYEEADGLILSDAGIVAAVFLADCLPVAVYDPYEKVGALCHAGWKGTLSGIAASAVEALVKRGCRRTNLLAAAGPGIGTCCFNVGEDVAAMFLKKHALASAVSQDTSGIFRIDLEQANLNMLKTAGLRENQLGRGGFCTACRPDEFFSYRKENGKTGRHAALMMLKG